MFWRFGMQTSSALDNILQQETVSLTEVLEEADLLQECKAKNPKLIEYLSKPSVAHQLIRYVTHLHEVPISPSQSPDVAEHTEDTCTKDEQTLHEDSTPSQDSAVQNSETVSKTPSEACFDSDDVNQNSDFSDQQLKCFIKYPYVVSEIFSSDLVELLDVVLNSTEITDDLLGFLDLPVPINPLQANHWSKIMSNLLIRKTISTLDLFKTREGICEKLVQHAIDNANIMDLLLKFVGVEELTEGREAETIKWLHTEKIVPQLVSYLDPTLLPDLHITATSALLDIIAMIQAISLEGERMEDNVLIKELKNEETTRRLVGFMLNMDAPYTASSLVNGVSLFVELIRRNSADMTALYNNQDENVNAPGAPDSPDRRVPMDLCDMVAVLCSHLKDFQAILVNQAFVDKDFKCTDALSSAPSKKFEGDPSIALVVPPMPVSATPESETSQTVAQVLVETPPSQVRYQPLGQARLRLCELLAELLRCAIDEAIMSPLDPQGPLCTMSIDLVSALNSLNPPCDTKITVKGAALQAELRNTFISTNILVSCLDLFFSFPWNNLLHGIVYDMILQLFNGQVEKRRPLVVHLLKDGQLTRRITQAHRLSDYECEQPKGVRLGYMGHITLIADAIVGYLERNEDVGVELSGILGEEDWQEYVTRTLKETRARESQPLGGIRPDASSGMGASMAGAGGSALSYAYQDDDDAMEVAGGVSTDQFARYLCQQVSSELPDRFGSTVDDDDQNQDMDWGDSFNPKSGMSEENDAGGSGGGSEGSSHRFYAGDDNGVGVSADVVLTPADMAAAFMRSASEESQDSREDMFDTPRPQNSESPKMADERATLDLVEEGGSDEETQGQS